MKNFYRFTFLLGIIFAANLCAANAQTVTGSLGNGTFTPGKTVKATVVLSLPGGLHANSHDPGSEYSVPTTVRASGKGVRVGSVSYPRGHNRKFDFSSETLNVYEGRTTFRFNVTVPANYSGSSLRVNVALKYQACTNEVCYPPKTKEITLTARKQ